MRIAKQHGIIVMRPLAVASWLLLAGTTAAWAQGGPSPVVVARVRQEAVAAGQTYVGTVMPAKTSAVGSAVDGRVVEYPIDIGVRVGKGEPLCKLLTETINLQIAAAEAELRLRTEELRELQNGMRPEEVEMAKARMESAAALNEFAQGRYKRAENLFQERKTLTQEQLEEYLSTSIAAARTLQAARQEFQMMSKGPREESIAQAQARVDAQAEMVQQLKDQLRKHTMISPFDGYVVAKRTEVGEWVTRSQVVAEVVYMDEVEVEAYVLDTQIDHVRIGMEARVEIAALDQPLYIGHVARVSPQADVKSRTFPVKVRVKNVIREDGPALKAGMLARVALPVGSANESLLVPKDAIVFGGPSPMVYVVTAAPPAPAGAAPGKEAPSAVAGSAALPAGEVVKPVPVELGVASGTWLQVKADLKAGDRVVVLGNERLRPGAPVSILREDDSAPPTAAVAPALSPAPGN